MTDTLQILEDTPARPRGKFYVAGTLTDIDAAGVPTVALTKPDGTNGPASGTVTRISTGIYDFALAASSTTAPTWYDITWTGNIGGAPTTIHTRVEVIGAFLFTVDQAFTFDGGAIAGAIGTTDTAKELVMAKRLEIGDRFERVCNVSFYRRFARETHDATGGDILLDHQRATDLVSVKVDGVADALAGYTLARSGVLRATSNYRPAWPIREGAANVTVEYIHGWDQVPGPISEAGLRVARAQLVPSNIGDRATSITSDAGTILLATAGRGQFQPYGIPLVDAVLADYVDPLAA